MARRYIDAAKDGYLDVLEQATKRDLNSTDEDGMTAVMWAAHNGHLDALRVIVGRGGDVDRCDYLGLTALHHAARKGLMHVVSYLVNWGANIFALDNDHHSALDLASIYDKVEVVKYLDQVYTQQQSKNPKHANRQREEAIRQSERNLRRYHKLQEEAARRVQKEQRKHNLAFSQDGVKNGGQGKNFIKSLTMAIRGGGGGGSRSHKSHGKAPSASGKSYSDIAGINQSVATPRGSTTTSTRHHNNSGDGAVNGEGELIVRRRPPAQSFSGRGPSSEVTYHMSGQPSNRAMVADGTSSRPTVYDVFENQHHPRKGNSELEAKDSGVVSYFGDEDEDEENAPGIFNRPGFGKTAFLTGNSFLNTLPSFQMDGDADSAAAAGNRTFSSSTTTNGYNLTRADSKEGSSKESLGLGSLGEGSWTDPKELPWDQEDVDKLDDDDEALTTSALETFLWSAGLEDYLHRFLQEKVDLPLLLDMSDEDLREIGLPFGPRRRLLEAVKRRKEVLSLPRCMTDSYL